MSIAKSPEIPRRRTSARDKKGHALRAGWAIASPSGVQGNFTRTYDTKAAAEKAARSFAGIARAIDAAITRAKATSNAEELVVRVAADGRVTVDEARSAAAFDRLLAEQAGGAAELSPRQLKAAMDRLQSRFDSVDEAAIESVIAEARERGGLRAAQILQQPDMLDASTFAGEIGISAVALHNKRNRKQVLGLEGAKRGYRFPAWQIGRDGKPLHALPQLFERLGDSPWTVYRFLTQRHPELDGKTAVEMLQAGREARVLEAAENSMSAAS
jgi:hypothetical protein